MSGGYRSVDDLNELFDGTRLGGEDYPEIIDDADRRVHLIDSGNGLPQIEDERPPNYGTPFRSDWDAMVERNERAHFGPNGQLLDDFDKEFQVKVAEHAEQQARSPYINHNPPSVSQAILGGQAQVVLGDLPKQVAAWTAEDNETRLVTVCFGAVAKLNAPSGLSGSNTAQRPVGTVQFGTRGYLLTVEVDIGVGCQLTVPGSSVLAYVSLDASTPAGAVNLPVTLTGMLSFAPSNKFRPVTRTIYLASLNNNQLSAMQFIPAFAKTIQVLRQSGNNTEEAFEIDYRDSSSSQFLKTPVAAGPMAETLIPPDAVAFQILNTGADPQVFRVIFGLCL